MLINKAPRGYKNVRTSKDSTHVEIDEKRAELIQSIFKEVSKGIEFLMSHLCFKLLEEITKRDIDLGIQI